MTALCTECQSEGRIYRKHSDPMRPDEEVDHGECPTCRGTGKVFATDEQISEFEDWARDAAPTIGPLIFKLDHLGYDSPVTNNLFRAFQSGASKAAARLLSAEGVLRQCRTHIRSPHFDSARHAAEGRDLVKLITAALQAAPPAEEHCDVCGAPSDPRADACANCG